eukprot:6184301-Pleurochrysis_carterae.AAC.6
MRQRPSDRLVSGLRLHLVCKLLIVGAAGAVIAQTALLYLLSRNPRASRESIGTEHHSPQWQPRPKLPPEVQPQSQSQPPPQLQHVLDRARTWAHLQRQETPRRRQQDSTGDAGESADVVAAPTTAKAARPSAPNRHISLPPAPSPPAAVALVRRGPQKPLPEERAESVCGREWQEAYSRRHAGAVSAWHERGVLPRLLVWEYQRGGGGLADRLVGMMTALLLAVLSDRVFQLDWAGHEVALRLPNIDGTALLHTLPRMRTRRLRWINRPRLELQVGGAARSPRLRFVRPRARFSSTRIGIGWTRLARSPCLPLPDSLATLPTPSFLLPICRKRSPLALSRPPPFHVAPSQPLDSQVDGPSYSIPS